MSGVKDKEKWEKIGKVCTVVCIIFTIIIIGIGCLLMYNASSNINDIMESVSNMKELFNGKNGIKTINSNMNKYNVSDCILFYSKNNIYSKGIITSKYENNLKVYYLQKQYYIPNNNNNNKQQKIKKIPSKMIINYHDIIHLIPKNDKFCLKYSNNINIYH